MQPKRSSFTRIFSKVSNIVYIYIYIQKIIFLTSGIEVFSSEQEFHVGCAAVMELERMDIAEGVLPIHDDVDSVKIHG